MSRRRLRRGKRHTLARLSIYPLYANWSCDSKSPTLRSAVHYNVPCSSQCVRDKTDRKFHDRVVHHSYGLASSSTWRTALAQNGNAGGGWSGFCRQRHHRTFTSRDNVLTIPDTGRGIAPTVTGVHNPHLRTLLILSNATARACVSSSRTGNVAMPSWLIVRDLVDVLAHQHRRA